MTNTFVNFGDDTFDNNTFDNDKNMWVLLGGNRFNLLTHKCICSNLNTINLKLPQLWWNIEV